MNKILTQLPIVKSGSNKGKVDYKNMNNMSLKILYNNIEYDVKIIDYYKEVGKRYFKFKIYYNGSINPDGICCSNFVKGCFDKIFNTIWNTHKYLVDNFGLDEEFAKTHTYGTTQKGRFICKDCGKTMFKNPHNVIRDKSIGCVCNDGRSYPEKFVANLFMQLGVEFEAQYNPEYFNDENNGKNIRRYSDFYIPSLNLIIETDGGLGHKGGKTHSKSNKTIEEYIEVDNWKDEQHKLHGLETIRIDCFESDMEYIKNSILNSKLNELFDLSKVDWLKCEEFALKNIVKEVCEYWEKNNNNENIIPHMTNIFKCNDNTIRNYLHKGNKQGWCNYKPLTGRNGGKSIKVYKEGVLVGVFDSASELSRKSIELFGVNFNIGNISKVCSGKSKSYKGFTFKYK